jgi:hypothetical protein
VAERLFNTSFHVAEHRQSGRTLVRAAVRALPSRATFPSFSLSSRTVLPPLASLRALSLSTLTEHCH